MTDRELLELIAVQVGTLTKDVSEIKEDFKNLNEKLGKIESKLNDMESNNADRYVLIGSDIKNIKY